MCRQLNTNNWNPITPMADFVVSCGHEVNLYSADMFFQLLKHS